MQPKITSFAKRKVPVVLKSQLTNMIARMCSQDLRPFAIVEGQGFINVAKELLQIGAKYGGSIEVRDVLPSAHTVSCHVEDEYEKVKKHVMEELQQVGQAPLPLHFVTLMFNVGLMQYFNPAVRVQLHKKVHFLGKIPSKY